VRYGSVVISPKEAAVPPAGGSAKRSKDLVVGHRLLAGDDPVLVERHEQILDMPYPLGIAGCAIGGARGRDNPPVAPARFAPASPEQSRIGVRRVDRGELVGDFLVMGNAHMKKAQSDFFLLNGCRGWTGGSNGQSCGANTAAQKKQENAAAMR
jgi:hypothetical protein